MLISLNWLKEYIDLDENISIEELEKALTMIGQEVEKIEKQGENLEKILTAKILKLEKHPNADSLTLCQVDNGTEQLQVVCGATNHKEGDIVAMAQVGAKLGDDFIIKKSKIRGEESNGMLCSEVEMKIGQNNDGIMILPKDTKLGIPMNKYLGLNDTIFELEITPNRPDCLSHIGIARELSAYYNKSLKLPKNLVSEEGKEDISINIDGNLSNRYIARVIKNVKVGPSPKWLKERLEAVGIRSINNLVDISNYVMLETNQPNHIFDFDKLNSKEIFIKNAENDEIIVTLDGNERKLQEDDIVVSNGKESVAIAGIMGGLNTEVDENTTNILIEVAHFDNIKVRKTSRRLSLNSESSYRFERRVDEDNLEFVVDRISYLVNKLAGGKICNINDEYKLRFEATNCLLNLDRMKRFIGKEIEKEKVIDIFKKLDIKVEDKGRELLLTPPSHRLDLVNQYDYFEEVIRLVGFDYIENTMPIIQVSKDRLLDTRKYTDDIRILSSNLGLREVINYSFIPKDSLEKINFEFKEEDILEIKNPIIEDFSIMRPTLMYSLIKNVKDNINRGAQNIRLFEVSRRFEMGESKNNKLVYVNNKAVLEKDTLAIVLAGKKEKGIWNSKPEFYDFYDIKGVFDSIFEKLGIKNYLLKRSLNKSYHPGRSADICIGKEILATFGTLHPDVEEKCDIENLGLVYGEIKLDLLGKYIKKDIVYKSLSKFQSVNRDIAIIVKKEVLAGDILKMLERIDKLVEKVELFDIYEGLGIEKGYKSIAISLLFRDSSKTLEEKEINDLMNKITDKLIKDYDAKIR